MLVGVCLATLASTACDQTGPSAIVPTEVPTPPGPDDLTGRVVEFGMFGERWPVPNLRLKVRTAGPAASFAGGADLPDVVTDQAGRYVIPNVAGTFPILFVETAPGSQHHFLCSPHQIFVRRFFTELPVVPVTWSGESVPPGMWISGTSVYGKVSERLGETSLPVAGATVTLDGGVPDPPATTNAVGFYIVCSVVGTDQYRTIAAEKVGYGTVARQILGGWEFNINLELNRQ